MKILLLCEKPSAAKRIAKALDDSGDPVEKRIGSVPYYESKNGDRLLIVVPALGHLYTVAPKVRNRNVYPVFDFEWVPRYEAERNAGNIKEWIDAISKLSREADEFILATDYDIEGATLGYTILKYACGGKEEEAKRMKFSTLTDSELKQSFKELLDHIEFPMVEAGICRHMLDAIYGINLSRAMTVAAKRWSGKYKTLSTGRVQGPTLKFLVEREIEINCFVPVPFWRIDAEVEINGETFKIEYEKSVIKRLKEAQSIVE
ncbi:MAG TPA: DNA topoisomerase I, partial [Candidatus Bathyarchaeota archaeon]|nr:DNA topoisomerase I [Candidatus Bathyarchaeota archaeon]